jgi:hypothetical protein
MTRDYVADNLDAPILDHLFPNMVEADKSATTWPYFRKEIDHPFRVDRRNPTVGFINRDEASILFANARAFAGRGGIEIGAWRGWSTAHLITAGLKPLHVVEPLLVDADWRREFVEVTRGAGGAKSAVLVADKSPEAVVQLGESGARWSFAFIDGDQGDGLSDRADDGSRVARGRRSGRPPAGPRAVLARSRSSRRYRDIRRPDRLIK